MYIEFSRIDGNRLHEVMIEIAKNSEHGWDQVIQPLTQLAMLLIDFASSQGFAASRPTTIATDNSGKSIHTKQYHIYIHLYEKINHFIYIIMISTSSSCD